MANVEVEDYGNYQIKSGKLGTVHVARAFPMPPAKTRGMIAEAQADSTAAAIEALKDQLAQMQSERLDARRKDETLNFAVPSEDEYTEALRQTRLSAPQAAMLKAHAVTGSLTPKELAKAAGYARPETAQSAYLKAGRALGEYLGIAPAATDSDAALLVIGHPEATEAEGVTRMTMHEELRSAVGSAL